MLIASQRELLCNSIFLCQVWLFCQTGTKSKFPFSSFFFYCTLEVNYMKIFWRVSYWLRHTDVRRCLHIGKQSPHPLPISYLTIPPKLLRIQCRTAPAHNDHMGRQEVCCVCVCVWALKLISSWCCSGAARVTSHWRYVTKWLPGGFCHDMMNASGLPALDSSRAIIFSNPPGVWLQLELAAEGEPRRRSSGRSSPWNLNCEISPATSAGRSVPRAILYLQQYQKKKKKKNQKHSPSAIDLNIFLSYKRRKLLLF